MIYHFTGTIPSFVSPDNVADQAGEAEVHQAQENGNDHHQENDDGRGPQGLFAVGPGYFFQLLDGFPDERDPAVPIFSEGRQFSPPGGPNLTGPQLDYLAPGRGGGPFLESPFAFHSVLFHLLSRSCFPQLKTDSAPLFPGRRLPP